MPKEISLRIAIVVISLLFFSFRAGDISAQFTGDENFYFQSAKNMAEDGDWLTPYYYGKPRFQKPILYYWFVAASFTLFGTGWYTARLSSILFGALVVLLTYLIGMSLFQKRAPSILSACILATTFKFFKYTRFAIPDMALLFFAVLSLYIFIKLLRRGERNGFLWPAFFLSLAFGTLTKGPIAVIIPVLMILSFRLFSKRGIPVRGSDIFLGILLYAVATLPWFLAMVKIHGADYVSRVWAREIAQRVLYRPEVAGETPGLGGYISSLAFYIPIVIIRFLPWSLFLPKGMIVSFSIARSGKQEDAGHLFLITWFFTVFAFFTLMGEKHSQYMLGLTVPFALIVGTGFSSASRVRQKGLILPVVIACVTAIIFLSFIANKGFKLNSAILGGFAAQILTSGLDETDKVGAGSHELIPQQIEVYIKKPVEKLGGRWVDEKENVRLHKLRLKNFFNTDKRAYCIISRDDFERYTHPELKSRLNIIYRDFLWKRKVDFSREKIILLFTGKFDQFVNSLKREYFLVTNR